MTFSGTIVHYRNCLSEFLHKNCWETTPTLSFPQTTVENRPDFLNNVHVIIVNALLWLAHQTWIESTIIDRACNFAKHAERVCTLCIFKRVSSVSKVLQGMLSPKQVSRKEFRARDAIRRKMLQTMNFSGILWYWLAYANVFFTNM